LNKNEIFLDLEVILVQVSLSGLTINYLVY